MERAGSRPMTRVRLIVWNADEARARAEALQAAGYRVVWRPPAGGEGLASLEARPPAAVIIDLSRLPSQGRDVGIMIRIRRATRHVPLVFVNGTRDAVAATKRHLPDAVFTNWRRLGRALRAAIDASPRRPPAVPSSVMAGYSGTPLPKKLGIKDGSTVVLLNAPDGFERALGTLPPGATVKRRKTRSRDLTLWFVTRLGDLERRIEAVARELGTTPLWIVWPKQTSPLAGDVREGDVRRIGLAHGLVDFKICAVDADWSGLKFVWRKVTR